MNDRELRDLYARIRTIATVGLSSNPQKDSYSVARYLQAQGYRVIPVNPTASEILGEHCYPDLASIPERVDVVQVFRPPEDVPAIVEQAIAIGAQVVWMQPGAENPAAAATAEAAGLRAVMQRCMRQEHIRLAASLQPR